MSLTSSMSIFAQLKTAFSFFSVSYITL